MIEQLRIQCPVCGTFLEVKNSKNEAVKRITCPKCKKQLSVDFQEKQPVTPKPLEAMYYGALRIEMQEGNNQIALPGCESIEMKVVRLNDGNSKCIVKSKSPRHQLMINGIALNYDDQVSLSIGDELITGSTVLTYGVPGHVGTSTHNNTQPPADNELDKVDEDSAHAKINGKWLIALFAVALFLLCGWLLAGKFHKDDMILSEPAVTQDSVEEPHKEVVAPVQPVGDNKKSQIERTKVSGNPIKEPANEPLSDYQLEINAQKGDVNAQYELGYRLIHKSGRNNVLTGLNYLKLAAQNGSQKAVSVYNKAISSLKQKVEAGDEVANDILMSLN